MVSVADKFFEGVQFPRGRHVTEAQSQEGKEQSDEGRQQEDGARADGRYDLIVTLVSGEPFGATIKVRYLQILKIMKSIKLEGYTFTSYKSYTFTSVSFSQRHDKSSQDMPHCSFAYLSAVGEELHKKELTSKSIFVEVYKYLDEKYVLAGGFVVARIHTNRPLLTIIDQVVQIANFCDF